MKDSLIKHQKHIIEQDPIAMYLVVHELGMSPGKIAAQCGHAVGMLYNKKNKIDHEFFLEHQLDIECPVDPPNLKIWYDWENTQYRKIVLTADDKEWQKIKEQFSIFDCVMVIDAGFTEIPNGSETVIGFWPMHRSSQPKLLKRLQALK